MSTTTLRPQDALPERTLHTHNTLSDGFDALGSSLKCCSLRSCRQGVFLSFSCKHCSATFCSDHSSPHAHQCVAGSWGADGTWTSPEDRQALVCEHCSKVVSEHAVTRSKALLQPELERGIEEAKGKLREARGALLMHVNGELHLSSVRGANANSFSSTVLQKDEEFVRATAPQELTRAISACESHLRALLLSAHLQAGFCGEKSRETQSAPKTNSCAFKRCKTKGFRQTCKKCNQCFCISHRLPEVHMCAAAKR